MARTVIDGMNAVRIFDVHQGAFLRLRGVTLQNGKADYDDKSHHSHGGAIHNHGTLSLDRVAVVNSTSSGTWGGGGLTNAGTGRLVRAHPVVRRDRVGVIRDHVSCSSCRPGSCTP